MPSAGIDSLTGRAMRRRYFFKGKDGPEAEEEVFFGVLMVVTLGRGERPYPHTQNLLQSPFRVWRP